MEGVNSPGLVYRQKELITTGLFADLHMCKLAHIHLHAKITHANTLIIFLCIQI